MVRRIQINLSVIVRFQTLVVKNGMGLTTILAARADAGHCAITRASPDERDKPVAHRAPVLLIAAQVGLQEFLLIQQARHHN